MKFIPEQKNKKVLFIFFTLAISGLIIFSIPNTLKVSPALFQPIGLCLVISGIFILTRYAFTSYIYELRMRSLTSDTDVNMAVEAIYTGYGMPSAIDFVVQKKQASRDSNMECVLSLDCLKHVVGIGKNCTAGSDVDIYKTTTDSIKAMRDKYGSTMTVYNYTVTLGCDDMLGLVFEDGDKYVFIIIEPCGDIGRVLTFIGSRHF